MVMVSAEIEEQIFSLKAPGRAPHVFDTAADGPSIEPVVASVNRKRQARCSDAAAINCEIGLKEGPTALSVEQRGTDCIAETARYISIKAALVLDMQKTELCRKE